jgi:hypothetical protein
MLCKWNCINGWIQLDRYIRWACPSCNPKANSGANHDLSALRHPTVRRAVQTTRGRGMPEQPAEDALTI